MILSLVGGLVFLVVFLSGSDFDNVVSSVKIFIVSDFLVLLLVFIYGVING